MFFDAKLCMNDYFVPYSYYIKGGCFYVSLVISLGQQMR